MTSKAGSFAFCDKIGKSLHFDYESAIRLEGLHSEKRLCV